MRNLLVICPSRGRPHRIMGMINSFDETTDPSYTKLIVLLDKDDPSVDQYMEVLPPHVGIRVYDRTGDKTLTTEIINRAFTEFKDYPYFSVTNDDIHYKTVGWDKALTQPLKISCGQDDTMVAKYGDRYIGNCNPGTFPITSVIDGDIVRAIGWLQHPDLRHTCGDNIWYWIGKRSDSLYSNTKYHTEHHSPYFGLGENDETYKNCNAFDNKADYYVYKEWLKYKCGREIIAVETLKREAEKVNKEVLV